MAAEDIIRAYGYSYDEIRLAVGDIASQLWLELGGPDDRRALEAAEAIIEAVNAAAADTAILVDAYIGEYVGAVAGTTSSASPLDLAQFTIDQLRNTPALDVYRRPAIAVRTALSRGVDYDTAMQQAAGRVEGMAQADIALAHREQARTSMTDHGLDHYRRVLTGASCRLCMIASTQRYVTGELMPIHSRCDCRVAPLVDGTDYGRVINRDLYRELKAQGAMDKITRGRARTAAGDPNTPLNRRAAAAARRQTAADARGQLPGLSPEQTRLEVATPTPAPAIRQHGELGPVLVDERHAFTEVKPGRGAAARLGDDAATIADTAPPKPAKVTTVDPAPPPATPPSSAPRGPAPATPAKKPRYTVNTPEVIRDAQRRNISPEQAAERLNAKAARRAQEAAATRAEARALADPSHPAVIKAAAKYGVTPDEIITAQGRVKELRRVIADEAATAQARTIGDLDAWEAVKMKRPPRAGQKTEFGRTARGGEYDFLEQLDERERGRLSRIWFDDSTVATPDLMAESISNALGRDVSVDEAVELWLDRNRTYEALGAIRRGKLPSDRAYSGAIDVDNLLPAIEADGYKVSQIVGVDDIEAAGHIAHTERLTLRRDAENYLGAALDPQHGPAPFRMSFQTWEEEVRDLEYGLRNYPDELPANAAARLEELVPYYLDEPGTSFEELYARIISTAAKAGEEIPEHARIPW